MPSYRASFRRVSFRVLSSWRMQVDLILGPTNHHVHNAIARHERRFKHPLRVRVVRLEVSDRAGERDDEKRDAREELVVVEFELAGAVSVGRLVELALGVDRAGGAVSRHAERAGEMARRQIGDD